MFALLIGQRAAVSAHDTLSQYEATAAAIGTALGGKEPEHIEKLRDTVFQGRGNIQDGAG